MLGLANIREWLKTLNNKANNYYIGKLDNKNDKSMGVYQLKNAGPMRIALGGFKNTSYRVKGISILIHWNTNARETEEFSCKLYEEILKQNSVVINSHIINYIEMINNEPIDIGTDSKGIYERVIELKFYYGRGNV
ncbi:MAG: minor capsid protein [Clostridium sp.]